jgi:hypothetical protein
MAVENGAVLSCFQRMLLTGEQGRLELFCRQAVQMMELYRIKRFVGMERR